MFDSRLELIVAGVTHLHGLTAVGVRQWHGSTPGDSRVPGPGLVTRLSAVDPGTLSAPEALDWLEGIERCRSWFAALSAEGLVAIGGARRRTDEYPAASRRVLLEDAIAEEVAAALRWSPRTARARLDAARELLGELAPLHAALTDGHISTGHVSAISREALRLPPDRRAGLAAAVVPYAVTHTAAESGRRARALVERDDPVEAERRRERARQSVDVDVMDDVDGQSVLSARMATPDAHAVLAAIGSLARDERFQPDDACTIGQRRVEALKALVLTPRPASGDDEVVADARVTAHIDVVVSLETMLGVADDPGELVGSGPIGAGAVRDLVRACSRTSTMRRLITDPDGVLLDVGRTRYAVSDEQREFLARRDATCRFPGCGRRARACQVDHAHPWDEGGRTDIANLGPLCCRHHNHKTHGGWLITESHADGSCVWLSPQRRRYRRERIPVLPVATDHDPPF